MIRPEQTPEELCEWFAPILARSLRVHKRRFLRWADDHEGLHITVGGKEGDKTTEEDPTLPEELWRNARPKTRDVYRAVDALWAARGPDPAPIMPADVIEWLGAYYASLPTADAKRDIPARSTVQHSLTELRELELVYQHDDGGWIKGRRQGRLTDGLCVPRQNGSASPVERGPAVSHASRVARDGRGYSERASTMFGKQIWVTGEKCDWTGGLIVTDADGSTYLAEGEQVKVRYETRTGRIARPPAVRCELVTVEDDGRYQVATVKVRTPPGKKQIRVRVLGDWQVEGRMSDREEPVELGAIS